MNLIDIGTALRKARKETQRSQAELAASLGMSRATISAIENGTVREIGVRKLMALAGAVGLEFSVAPVRMRPTLQELREEHRADKRRT